MENLKNKRLGLEKKNNQGCVMKIVEYNSAKDLIVEFQDEHKFKVRGRFAHFQDGGIRNPYFKSVYGVGFTGNITTKRNGQDSKEYKTWHGMLERCFDEKYKIRYSTYKNVTCCDEWLCFENFYKWLHEQENFEKWLNREGWNLDKDILIKGNKIYSPETCTLVSEAINSLFIRRDEYRGEYPIGVHFHKAKNKFISQCAKNSKLINLGEYETSEEAFYAYKQYKENLIKEIANEEFKKGNITEKCYNAMMAYEVEITD